VLVLSAPGGGSAGAFVTDVLLAETTRVMAAGWPGRESDDGLMKR
jgi:hypothetical protein